MARRKNAVLKERKLKLEAQIEILEEYGKEAEFKNKAEEFKLVTKIQNLKIKKDLINDLISETTESPDALPSDQENADKDTPGS